MFGAAWDTVAQAADCTVATAVKVLLPVFGSGGVPESVTVAVFAYAPEAAAVSTTATVAFAPLASVPMVQVIGPVPVQVTPALGVTETSVIPAARASESETAFAAEVPLLKTVML